MTTEASDWLFSFKLKVLLSLFHSRNLWIVDASSKVNSLRRLLALPVGANNFILVLWFCFFKALYIPYTTVVFPVPGPPVITKKLFFKLLRIASFW